MIWSLGPIFYLAQTFMHISGRLPDGLGKKLVIHKMGAGTGSKETAVFHQLHGTEIDLTIALSPHS